MRYSVKNRQKGKEVGHIVAEDLETSLILFNADYKLQDVFMEEDK